MSASRTNNRILKAMTTAGSVAAMAFQLMGCNVAALQGAVGGSVSGEISAVMDFGDAPDMNRSDPGFPGAGFPTILASNGAHHLDITKSALGHFRADGSLSVSAEDDAIDPDDSDGLPNLDDALGADQDKYDDGFMMGYLPAGGMFEFPVVVSVDADAADQTRYVNILADWDGNLQWNGVDPDAVPEWVVQNAEVTVAPGTEERVFLPAAQVGSRIYDIWYRVTLSEKPVDPADYPEGWDGSGEFEEGETEDYYVPYVPQDEIVPEDGGSYDPGPGDGEDDDDGLDGEPDPDDPDGDGNPGVDPNNVGKLQRRIANHYSLVLCKGKTWGRGFEYETKVQNGTTSNPFTAGVGLSNDPGRITIHAKDVGTSRVSFEANEITFPYETEEWVTGVIDVTVIDCDPAAEDVGDGNAGDGDDDGDGKADDDGGPWDGIDNAGPEDAGKLVHAQGNEYYLVLCHCDGPYSRGFQYETRVKNPQSSDAGVAGLSVENDPGSITITPTGYGETTLTFEADPVTFPYDEAEYATITIHVKVIDCTEYYMNMEGLQ